MLAPAVARMMPLRHVDFQRQEFQAALNYVTSGLKCGGLVAWWPCPQLLAHKAIAFLVH